MPKKSISKTQKQLVAENKDLRVRLDEAEDTLRAIRSGEVDALVVPGAGGEQVFTLKDANRPYRVLIEEMNDGALTLTADGVILYANRHFAEMLKTPLEKVIGSTIHTWIAPDRQRILQALLQKGADEKRREELVLTASDGTLVPVYLSVNRLLPSDETPASFCLVATDLTEQKRIGAIVASEKSAQELLTATNQSRLALLSVIEDQKQAEEALRESEERYRLISAVTSDYMFSTRVEADGRLTLNWVAGAFEAITGYTFEDYIAHGGWRATVHPDDLAIDDRDMEKLRANQPVVTELRTLTKSGQVMWVQVYAHPVRDAEREELVGIYGAVQDITERKRAEEALRESEQRFRWLFTTSPDAILLIDPHTSNAWPILDCNEAACQMNGYTREELIGQSIDLLNTAPGIREERLAYLDRLRREGVFHLETFHRHQDGHVFPIETSTSLFMFEGRELVLGIDRDITERKQAEEELQKLSRRNEDALRIAGMGYWEFDVASAQFTFNDQYFSLHGMTAEDAGGYLMSVENYMSRYVHPDDAHLVGEAIQQALETNDANLEFQREGRILRADGEPRSITIWFHIEQDPQGRNIKLVGVNQDITERKRAEEALRESRALFRSLIESLPQNIYTKDTRGRFVFANQRYCATQGKSLEEIVGKIDVELHPPELAEKYQRDDRLVMETGQAIESEEEHQPLGGNRFWGHVIKAPLYDAQGHITGTLGIFWDVTERRRMEEALREAETKYRTLVEQIPAVVYMDALDALSTTLYISPQVQAMSGYSPEEWTANPSLWLDLVHPQDRPRVLEENIRMNVTSGPYQSEYRLVTRDGRVVWVHDDAVVIGDRAGQPQYWQGIMVDITERKRMEKALQDKVSALQTLAEIDREIIAATESQNILDLVCRRAAELVHAPKSVIAIGTSPDRMEMAASYGLSDPARASREFAQFWQAGVIRPVVHEARTTIAVNDVPADSSHMPEFQASENIRALVLVPLAAGQETLGALAVFDTAPREWLADEIEVLSMLAGQTAIALEKVRLYQAARSRAAHLAMLNEIDQAITSTLDLDRVLLILLNRVQQVSSAEACSVALVDEATGDLVFRQAVGGAGQSVIGVRLAPGQGIAGWVAQHGCSVLALDVASDPRFYREVDSRSGYITRDIVCAPLIAHDSVIGVIELLNKSPLTSGGQAGGRFSEGDTRLLESVAAQAAIAIENARLFLAEREQREFAETLGQVGATLASALDAEIVLDRLLEHVSRVIPNDAANVMLVEGDHVRIVRSRGYDRFGAQAFISAFATPLAGLSGLRRIIETGEPLFVPDTHADPGWVRYPELEWQRSYAVAPIRVRGQVIGFLNADSATPGLYGPAHAGRLRAFADQAAIAIENARLYEAQRQQTEDLDAINAVIRMAASSLDLDALLQDTMRELHRLVAFDRASLALIDESRQTFTMMALQDPGQPILAKGVTMSMNDTAAADDVLAGRTHVTDDLSTETAFAGERMLFQAGSRSRVNVPLVHAGRTMGALSLASTRPAAFDRRRVNLLEQIAGPLAIAIENARLFETERVGRQRLETLYRVGQALNSTLDANAILDRLTDEVLHITMATHGSALVARPDLSCFERRSLRGYSEQEAETARAVPLPLDRGLNGRAYRTGRPVYLSDVRNDAGYYALIQATRSELVVPIVRGGQVIGNLDLQSPEVNAFRDVELGFLQALTDQVAIALENARLFEETHRRLEELAVVSQVALAGAAGRPFDETVERATQALTRLWPDAFLGFLFVDEATQSLRLHPSYYGVPPETLAAVSIPLGQGITGWSARERQPVRVGDVKADPRYIAQVPGIQSEMAAPLVAGDRILGVVNVNSPRPDAFAGDDLRLLATLAGQLATIFEKARLDAELAQHAAMLEQRVRERTAELRGANEQLRLADEQVRQALEKERELGELKSHFISMASHEFRTPLSSILSSSEMIEHYGYKWTEEKKLQRLKRIQASVRHMVELLDDVLIIGKAEAGKLEFNPATLDLEDFCREMMEEMQLQAGAAHKLIFVSRGQCAGATLDEKLLRQILANLLSNAIKYSPQGGEVRLELDCQADQVVLRVQDHGLGIPREAQGRLFDTFHRAANVGNIPGTGLGLSIVKKAVDLHGGAITFTSQVDAGTVFTVTLPWSQPAQEENP